MRCPICGSNGIESDSGQVKVKTATRTKEKRTCDNCAKELMETL